MREEEENRERVKGKMTPMLRNTRTGGRKRRKTDCDLRKPTTVGRY